MSDQVVILQAWAKFRLDGRTSPAPPFPMKPGLP